MAVTLPEATARATPRRRRPPWRAAARALTIVAVIAATLAGGFLALVSYHQERGLSVGDIRLSVSPGHRGALDVYVPLVDWGARFESIRLPARLRVDLRTVDRTSLQQIADGGELDVRAVRAEARDAIASYLRALIGVVTLYALALGLLTAFAVRHRVGPKLRYTVAAAAVTALALALALAVLLPPRGEIATPQYYAYGADIPRALDAVSTVRRSGAALDQELDAQLVGLARLVTAPAGRAPVEGAPRATIASDLHNNVITLPILERAARGGPVLFPGDLSDRGSPLEAALVARVAEIGRPFVFVTGNHDSDRSAQELADDGAIVLTQHGRLQRGGGYGPVINDIAGMRVAGYSDPFTRRAAENYRDRFELSPTADQQQAFADWLRPLVGKVDVVMVHEPALIAEALEELDVIPPDKPLVFVVGHTHKPELTRYGPVTVINGGSIGGGGTGNLTDGKTDVGLARLSYARGEGFQPLAADLVGIDPGSGAATARRERLDEAGVALTSVGSNRMEAQQFIAEEVIPRLRGLLHAHAAWVAAAASLILVALAPTAGARVAAVIYGAGLIALFSASALYHRWPGDPRWKPWLRRLDHCTIFVFIAASYTPVALLVLDGTLRLIVLVSVWAGALAGVTLSLAWITAPRWLQASCYLAVGWVAVIAFPQLAERAGIAPLLLLAIGGALYTLGAIVYACRRPDLWPRTYGFHEVFHTLVIAAALAHFIAMAGWVVPSAGS